MLLRVTCNELEGIFGDSARLCSRHTKGALHV